MALSSIAIICLAALVALAMTLAINAFILRRVINPVEDMALTANAISHDDLSRRVPIINKNEILSPIAKVLKRGKIQTMTQLPSTLSLINQNASHTPLIQRPLIIIVGLTGVGKSTSLELLAQNCKFSLLPNRRTLTDAVIIASLQLEDGQTPHLVKNRLKRFEYTARYRQQYSGGMAHALSQLAVDQHAWSSPIFFDGLRGLNEVSHAASTLPLSRFVVLTAPDILRLQRLLQRGDTFDQADKSVQNSNQDLYLQLSQLNHNDHVFSVDDIYKISTWPATLGLTSGDVLQKTKIILSEAKNYNPQAAALFLECLDSQRVLFIDTQYRTPDQVSHDIANWL